MMEANNDSRLSSDGSEEDDSFKALQSDIEKAQKLLEELEKKKQLLRKKKSKKKGAEPQPEEEPQEEQAEVPKEDPISSTLQQNSTLETNSTLEQVEKVTVKSEGDLDDKNASPKEPRVGTIKLVSLATLLAPAPSADSSLIVISDSDDCPLAKSPEKKKKKKSTRDTADILDELHQKESAKRVTRGAVKSVSDEKKKLSFDKIRNRIKPLRLGIKQDEEKRRSSRKQRNSKDVKNSKEVSDSDTSKEDEEDAVKENGVSADKDSVPVDEDEDNTFLRTPQGKIFKKKYRKPGPKSKRPILLENDDSSESDSNRVNRNSDSDTEKKESEEPSSIINNNFGEKSVKAAESSKTTEIKKRKIGPKSRTQKEKVAESSSEETEEAQTPRKIFSSTPRKSPTFSSPNKSILKSDPNKTTSPDKKVSFSLEKVQVNVYPPEVSSSESSSDDDDDSDDSDYAVKPLKEVAARSVSSRRRIGPASKTLDTVVVYSERAKEDAKLFKKCFVNVSRINTSKNLSSSSSSSVPHKSSEPREMPKMHDKAPPAKRSRFVRNQENSSSDSDAKSKAEKRNKKDGSQSRVGDEKENRRDNKVNSANNRKNEERIHKNDDPKHNEDSESDDQRVENHHVSDIHSQSTDKETTDVNNSTPEKRSSKKSRKDNKKSSGSSSSSESDLEKAKNKRKKPTKRRVLSDSDESAAENYERASSSSSSDSDSRPLEEIAPKGKNKRSRIKKRAVDSDEDDGKTTRKQIRKVIARDSLAETTKQAEKAERERKARIAERQKRYNNIYDADKLEDSTLSKLVLDVNDETEEEVLTVDPEFLKHLKPHQAKGIQFMWDACFESLDRIQSSEGSGCILAHCMGLGKTLQVIALVHTLIANRDKTSVERVLVVCPLSTVLNWVAEFRKWLPDDDEVQVYNLVPFKQNRERIAHVMDWFRNGGVLVLGYDMYRNLSNESNKRMLKKMRVDFQKALADPGPDLVICDEGHLLKNEKTSISKAMSRIRTLRRIVLTGTPLQNNLKEYYCMVQFVKPNLLGTYKEYLNRFVNPITNGQYTDSTQHDINVMRRRSHVLHTMLDGIVQRKDYSVLAPFLPPKHEYVLFVSLTQTQIHLYSHYLQNYAQQSTNGRTSLFPDFQEFQRICTHPRVLLNKSIQNRIAQDKRDMENDEDDSEGSLKDFLDDGDSDADTTSSDNDDDDDEDGGDKPKSPKPKPEIFTRRTRAMGDVTAHVELGVDAEENKPSEWWSQFTTGDELENITHSGKLSLLFEILHQCEVIGDKVLIFSQSLYSLSVIEYFLGKIDEAAQNGDFSMVKGYASSWSLGLDYFRLDGSSSCDNRAAWCDTFNDPENTRARLFLISTRAGGLGINLVAANRVIIFDVSWNPSHDIQSIYRVYRFGQTKPCYVYRFVTMGTMEMKIYERQVTKQAISKRVIDEQQIDRHYNQHDLQELYKFDPKPANRPLPAPPKDILLGELLQGMSELIYKYHEHQSLLENKEDEVLNEQERKAAWAEFENEKKLIKNTTGNHINNIPMHNVVAALTNIVKREHPTYTDQEISGVMSQLVAELRNQVAIGDYTMFSKVLAEVKLIQAAQQVRVQEYYQQQQQQMWMMRQLQTQFPSLTPADIQKIVQTQLTNYMPAAFQARPPPPAPVPQIPPAASTSTNDIINLED